jgi:hypothetical protein
MRPNRSLNSDASPAALRAICSARYLGPLGVMKAAVAMSLLLLLTSCKSVTYYKPDNLSLTERGGNACSVAVHYEQSLGEGIYVSLLTETIANGVTVAVSFRVPYGKSIRLSSSEAVINGPGGIARSASFSQFRAGSLPLHVPIQMLGPSETLVGTERYKDIAAPYGPDDRFVATLNVAESKIPAFSIQLPTMMVSGRPVIVAPVGFTLSTEMRSQCVQ